MYTSSPAEQILRFELIVSGDDYRNLVAHLRGQQATGASGSTGRKEVKAVIDLYPGSQHFAVTKVDRHKLPKPLGIRAGSAIHQHLARVLSEEIKKDSNATKHNSVLLRQLQDIIDRCPTVVSDTIRADRHDFQLHDSPLPVPSSIVELPVLSRLAPSLLFDLDDAPTLIIKTPELSEIARIESTVRAAMAKSSSPRATVVGNTVSITYAITLPPIPADCSVDLFLHWGSYEDLAPTWADELLGTASSSSRSQKLSFSFDGHVPVQGWYGATVYAHVNNSSERLWLGSPRLGDTKFQILRDEFLTPIDHATGLVAQKKAALARIYEDLSNPPLFRGLSAWFSEQCPQLSPGDSLAQAFTARGDEATSLASLSSHLEALGLRDTITMLQTSYGLGEIVFATPEGPHAGAGGLAQVISGLPIELSRLGIPTTIITPLYRHRNGHKHTCAEAVLESGILIGSEKVIPTYQTTISIHLGPTHYAGTPWIKRPSSTVTCKVYLAQAGRVRIFLLSASGVFDRLYEPVFSDEQLRRAIIFSRAVLETIATEALGIRPSAILSNDWMTACIPSLAALDPKYQNVSWLQTSKTIHMIHNGGADYHGRLPIIVNGEDLWPMFNLSPEHYFGFKDPFRDELINVTMAAVQHAHGGVITVSQPYAQQLASDSLGGDGLGYVLQHKRHSVFGVSNGIKREDVDAFLSLKTNLPTERLKEPTVLLAAKSELLRVVQTRYGLSTSANAKLLSFVGRIAEQKGLQLLSGTVANTHHSTLEELLIRHPDVQILIAGPVTTGDPCGTALCECVYYLSRKYPGRIASVFDYIPHSTALEITAASTLFLMPSRFEPGGITQLEALAVGTLVVGRAVGGIAATISNFDPTLLRGTGFLCNDYTPTAFANTTHWALSVCQDTSTYLSLVKQALNARHSWSDRAPIFAAVLQRMVLGEERMESLPFLELQRSLSMTSRAQ